MDNLFSLPDPETLYHALVARDPSYEGRALVGVSSTGIFCRLTCPARKPRPEHCRWFDSPAAALAAGFRPCRRCHPLGPQAEGDGTVRHLLAALDADPARRWTEADVAALGHDPSTVRRAFRRHYGMTFLELARQMRLREGVDRLRQGGAVIDAQLDAGFDSASGFREAFARLFGHPPQAMAAGQPGLSADWIDTPLGGMIAVADAHSLHLLEFVGRKALAQGLRHLSALAGGRIGLGRTAVTLETERQLARYFAGESAGFDLPLTLHGTDFHRQVWSELRRIRPGETISYAELAARIDADRARQVFNT
ncbi:MAG TPA: trifunctional transcriptional activator/DNA repair protein Ada/methylated-DNA--[protein]-cysteine S-methyltransferase, partial [Paracoccus sp. (in: a-proteobacteria)]|nr:trifunctional transcriptional activator/DNA repair protein Ada/methylated-DNA--[protein]-cysteine S-methyltransferase [Paracoccus sp. (in: a-proteobacteria)]